MFKRIDHVEIVPSNFEKSLDFYTNVLGFKIKDRRKIERPPLEELAFLELNDSVLELFSVANPVAPSSDAWQIGCRRIALEVEDMDKVVEHLKAKGVELTSGVIVSPTGKRGEIKDPDGLSIELLQR
ncbi:MAG: VOC family protein [Chloroflexi bacterium]|nr:VOC family protein [Chloroflexota bacterium]